MLDSFKRKIDYLRFSVTDRCDLRCKYCMPQKMKFTQKEDSLSVKEMKIISNIFFDLGFKKIRITGGEPLIRKDIIDFLSFLNSKLKSKLISEISLTTNGTMLNKYANQIYQNGIRRINVSLDSLIPEKYSFITNGGNLKKVLDGIYCIKKTGIKVKINTVLLKGFNEDELIKFIEWCSKNEFDISFIEVMPIGEFGVKRKDQFVSIDIAKSIIEKKYSLNKIDYKTNGPSTYFLNNKLNCKMGFISPISNNFCESCNRVRVTSNGIMYGCLGRENSINLKKLILNENLELLKKKIKHTIYNKPKKHFFDISKIDSDLGRYMNLTGG